MWSVPFNLNLRDTYYAIGMVYQKVRERERVCVCKKDRERDRETDTQR